MSSEPACKRVKHESGLVIVTKTRAECETEQKIYDLLQNQDGPYAIAKVDLVNCTVATMQGHEVRLNNISTIRSVLHHLQTQLHEKHVLHGDLKPQHILQNDAGQLFFIDFGYSCDMRQQENRSTGFTLSMASVDRILLETEHELDDYEAIFVCALIELGGLGYVKVPPRESESHKTWASWKLQLMDYVYAISGTTRQPVITYVAKKLMLMWTLPRTTRLTPANKAALLDEDSTVDMHEHEERIRGLFLSHLDQKGANGERLSGALHSPHEAFNQFEGHPQARIAADSALLQRNPDVIVCPSVTYWKEAESRHDFEARTGKHQGDSLKVEEHREAIPCAEYAALVYNRGGAWDHGSQWKHFGEDKYSIKLLHNAGGRFLIYLDAANNKDIFSLLLSTLETFTKRYDLRPIDILLLVIGIRIECHNQPFSPLLLLDSIKHNANCKCVPLTPKESKKMLRCTICGYFFCENCKHFCEDCKCTHDLVEFEQKYVELLPNLSLLTLLLAGRVSFANASSLPASQAGRLTSTSITRQLKEENERLQLKIQELELEWERQTTQQLELTRQLEKSWEVRTVQDWTNQFPPPVLPNQFQTHPTLSAPQGFPLLQGPVFAAPGAALYPNHPYSNPFQVTPLPSHSQVFPFQNHPAFPLQHHQHLQEQGWALQSQIHPAAPADGRGFHTSYSSSPWPILPHQGHSYSSQPIPLLQRAGLLQNPQKRPDREPPLLPMPPTRPFLLPHPRRHMPAFPR